MKEEKNMPSLIVAPYDASEQTKKRADLVCTGEKDEKILHQSLMGAQTYKVLKDCSPHEQTESSCIGRHSVEWLPGTYRLSGTLVIPDAADMVIQAEGTYFVYEPGDGNAVEIEGANRCRYRFGTIESASSGAALMVWPKNTSTLMSFIEFQGLIGKGQRGVGLELKPRSGVCVNRFTGTDIRGFDVGVLVNDAGEYLPDGTARLDGKCDTNHYWISYIRECNTCIHEKHIGVDSADWNVNVDATLPGSVAIRTAAEYGRWNVIMGTYHFERVNYCVIFDPGAKDNLIYMHPHLSTCFVMRDDSGNDTNFLIGTDTLRQCRANFARAVSP